MKFSGNCHFASGGLFLHKKNSYFTAAGNKMKLSVDTSHLPLLELQKEQSAGFLCHACEGIDGHGSGPLLLCCPGPSRVFHLLADEQDLLPRSAPSQLCSGLFLETGRIPPSGLK